jgi:Plasmid stabilization system protein
MKVFWTQEAKDTFNSNIDYLLLEWGEVVTSHFLDRVDQVILRITKSPNLYPIVIRGERIHRCVVVKQISLYYRIVSDEQIDLLTFWNNYQNPERLKI